MSLIQFESSMYLCDMHRLSEELFYQMLLYDFENFKRFEFESPLPIKSLAVLALNNEESGWSEEDGPKEELAQNVCDLLVDKADMLKEYYGMSITSDAYIKSMPILLGKIYALSISAVESLIHRLLCRQPSTGNGPSSDLSAAAGHRGRLELRKGVLRNIFPRNGTLLCPHLIHHRRGPLEMANRTHPLRLC